jgi:hypothetical protein
MKLNKYYPNGGNTERIFEVQDRAQGRAFVLAV